MSMKELRVDLESIAGVIKGCLEHHGAAHWCVGLVVINPNEDDDSIVLVEPGHEAQIKRVVARVLDRTLLDSLGGLGIEGNPWQQPDRPSDPTPPLNDVKLTVIEGGKKDDSEDG